MTTRTFEFRLGTVLRVRRVEETRAREVLAAARRDVARRSAEAKRARADCDALPSTLPPMPLHEFYALRARARWLAERAAGAAAALDAAVAEHELARQEMLLANQKVSALERLADRRKLEWQDEVARSGAVELDDVVGARSAAARLNSLESAAPRSRPASGAAR